MALENNDGPKKGHNSNNTDSSTLSLHITAYENSVEPNFLDAEDVVKKNKLIKSWQVTNKADTFSTAVIQNPFEFPRQRESGATPPEVSQYRASQELYNPFQLYRFEEPSNSDVSAQFYHNPIVKLTRTEIIEKIESGEYNLTEIDKKFPFMKWIVSENKPVGILCEVCSKTLSKHRNTAYYAHVENCHKKFNPQLLPPAKFSPDHKEIFTKCMLDSLSKDLLPFAYFETEGFKNCIQTAINLTFDAIKGGFGPPSASQLVVSRHTLRRRLFHSVEEGTPLLFDFISSNVKAFGGAVSIDMTSHKKHYIGTVIHFFDQFWQLHSYSIDIHQFSVSSTSENIFSDTVTMLAKLGLEPSDVVFVTDEGQNMVSAFQYDQELIKCICHGLHTIAKRSLKPYIDSSIVLGEVTLQYLADMEQKIGKLKKLIGAVRSRLNLHDSLTVRLGLEGDTRWLSKINMVDKYLKLAEDDHSKIDNYFRNEKDTELRQLALDVSDSKEDLVYFSTIFGPFQEAIRRLERDKSPTMNKVLETFYSLKEKITSFNNSDIPMISELSISILAVMDHKERMLINDNHLISVTLDPSKKNDLFNMIGREKFEIIKQKFEGKIRGQT